MAKQHHHSDYSTDYSNQINRASDYDDFDEYETPRRKIRKPRQQSKRSRQTRYAGAQNWNDYDRRGAYDDDDESYN